MRLKRAAGGAQHVMQTAPFPAVLLSVLLRVDARAANNWDEVH